MRNLQGWSRAPHVGESWPVASETNMDTLAKRDACERSAAAAAADDDDDDDALDIEDDAEDAAVNTDRDFPLDVCVCPVTKWRRRIRRRRWRMSMGSDCRGGQGRRCVRIKVAAARVTRHTLRAIKNQHTNPPTAIIHGYFSKMPATNLLHFTPAPLPPPPPQPRCWLHPNDATRSRASTRVQRYCLQPSAKGGSIISSNT